MEDAGIRPHDRPSIVVTVSLVGGSYQPLLRSPSSQPLWTTSSESTAARIGCVLRQLSADSVPLLPHCDCNALIVQGCHVALPLLATQVRSWTHIVIRMRFLHINCHMHCIFGADSGAVGAGSATAVRCRTARGSWDGSTSGQDGGCSCCRRRPAEPQHSWHSTIADSFVRSMPPTTYVVLLVK